MDQQNEAWLGSGPVWRVCEEICQPRIAVHYSTPRRLIGSLVLLGSTRIVLLTSTYFQLRISTGSARPGRRPGKQCKQEFLWASRNAKQKALLFSKAFRNEAVLR